MSKQAPLAQWRGKVDALRPFLADCAGLSNVQIANQRGNITPDQAASISQRVLDVLDLKADDILLEVGCGTGELSRACALNVFEVVGIDISPELIDRAKRESAGVHNLRFEQADGTSLPYAPQTFTKGLLYNVVPYLPRSVLRSVLQEIRRVTRPGSLVLVGDVCDPRKRWVQQRRWVGAGRARSAARASTVLLLWLARRSSALLPATARMLDDRGCGWYTPGEFLALLESLEMQGELIPQTPEMPFSAWRYDVVVRL